MKGLGGWHRLWIVVSVAWILFCGLVAYEAFGGRVLDSQDRRFILVFFLGPPAVLYAVGLGGRWIYKGFKRG